MKDALIISFTNLKKDPRVYRQIQFLRDDYSVIAVGTADPQISGVKFVKIEINTLKRNNLINSAFNALKLLLRIYKSRYWQNENIKHIKRNIVNIKKDIIIANDIECLPLALEISGDAKVVFDAHEYAPRQFNNSLIWRIFFRGYIEYLCKEYIPKVDGMITVCHGIADKYYKLTGIKPEVLINAPFYHELIPRIRTKANKTIKLIHHGGAIRQRKLEKMIKMMDYLDERFNLYLMLVDSSDNYLSELKQISKGKDNIIFADPVSMKKLPEMLNDYDIGVYILEPSNENHYYSLPNKFFEFIQARLAVAIGPSPEMTAIVNKYDCGIIAEDFSPKKMATCLERLDYKKLNYYKRNADRAARELNAENNKSILLEIMNKVTG